MKLAERAHPTAARTASPKLAIVSLILILILWTSPSLQRRSTSGVVFIEEKSASVIATMQCKTSQAVQQVAPVFESVLASYHFLTAHVKLAEDKRARRRR